MKYIFINLLSISLHKARLLECTPVTPVANYVASLQANVDFYVTFNLRLKLKIKKRCN